MVANNRLSIGSDCLEHVAGFLAAVSRNEPPTREQSDAWYEFQPVCDQLIRRFVRRNIHARTGLEDCVQETWLRLLPLLRDADYDRSKASFESWLYGIVRNATANYFRKEKRNRRSRDAEMADHCETDSSSNPLNACILEESAFVAARLLMLIRQHVSEKNFELACMRWLQSMSTTEVALALQLTREQVWYREHRMRNKLRSILAAEDPELSATGANVEGASMSIEAIEQLVEKQRLVA
jgi:RNA polymerase sigma-70 factor (ECF subfamily)